MPLAAGSRLGPYEIVAPIGAGGMGEVYRARDTRLGRTVAIKVLPASLTSDAERRARFEREARAASALNHPNICTVHDIGRQESSDYIVMEHVEGETLNQRLVRGPLPVEQVLRYGAEIADALAAAHRAGIVHRDLKPGNVMLAKTGAKLLDFGLAKLRVERMGVSLVSQLATATVEEPLTSAGTVMGTFHYMAPEQLEGKEADNRSDIWALGCVLYEMATGRRAFESSSQAALMSSILRDEPRPMREVQPLTPSSLDRVVRKCLAKDPETRWDGAHDVADELRWTAEERTVAATPPPAPSGRRTWSRRIWIAAVPLLAVAVVVGLRAQFGAGRAGRPPTPVIVLMDSPNPLRVYDPETLKRGGTNADDLTDLLRDLPVVLLKENTSSNWHREDQVLQENPDLILVHRSCFYDPTELADPKFQPRLYELAADKLDMFLGYVGRANPRTKFLVYSRRGFHSPTSWPPVAEAAARDRWLADIQKRFPTLKGRVSAWMVPLDRATFRHPATGAEIKQQVRTLLDLGNSPAALTAPPPRS